MFLVHFRLNVAQGATRKDSWELYADNEKNNGG